MQGYLNNAEATAATVDADGWLHTGDIAVVDADGFFEIVDRLKELIKYKGFQVAPAELEALIITHPEVADVAVIGVPDEEAGELPKAFVVAAGDDLDADELMEWVADQVSPQKRIRLVEVDRRDPEVALGQDPAPRAQGAGEGRLGLAPNADAGGVPAGRRPRASSWPRCDSTGADAAHAEQLPDQDPRSAQRRCQW